MKKLWRPDWFLAFFVSIIVIEIITTAHLAKDIGKKSLGIILVGDSISAKLDVQLQTPSWWPGLHKQPMQDNELTYFKPWDTLWKSNDACFAYSRETLSDKILQTSAKSVDLSIIRDNQCIHLSNVPLFEFTSNMFWDAWLSNAINWLGFFCLAITLYFSAPKEPINRSAALVMGLTAALFSFDRFWIYPELNLSYTLLEVGGIITRGWIAAALFQLAFVYPTPLPVKYHRWILHPIYAICALITCAYCGLHFLYWALGKNNMPDLYFLASILDILSLAVVSMRMFSAIAQTKDPSLRKQMFIPFVGILLTLPFLILYADAVRTGTILMPVLIAASLWLLFAVLRSNLLKGKPWALRGGVSSIIFLAYWVYTYVFPNWLNKNLFFGNFDMKYLMLFIPLTMAYVIIRYKAFRGANNVLVFVLVLMISAILAGGVAGYQYKQIVALSPADAFSGKIAHPFPYLFSVSFPFGLLFSSMGSIKGILGRFLYRRESNYEIVKNFSDNLAGYLERDSLPVHISQTLQKVLKLSGVAFWEQKSDGLILVSQVGKFEQPLPPSLDLLDDSIPLPEKPFQFNDPSLVSGFFSRLQSYNLQVGMCLVSADTKKLLGFIAVGSRDEEEFYDDLDLETLGILAQQISQLLLVTNSMKEREIAYQWAGEAEEQERRRIERDLHDTVGQYFHGQGKLLETIIEPMPEGRIKMLLQRCTDETYKTAQELRVIINNLAYEQLKGNVAQALEEYVAHFQQQTRLSVSAQINLPGSTLISDKHRIALYRVIRQALENISAHARAKNVTIMVCQTEKQIDFFVSDDGCGFTLERRTDAIQQHHFGLWSMEGRIQDLDGEIDIQSAVGKGTQIRGMLPI